MDSVHGQSVILMPVSTEPVPGYTTALKSLLRSGKAVVYGTGFDIDQAANLAAVLTASGRVRITRVNCDLVRSDPSDDSSPYTGRLSITLETCRQREWEEAKPEQSVRPDKVIGQGWQVKYVGVLLGGLGALKTVNGTARGMNLPAAVTAIAALEHKKACRVGKFSLRFERHMRKYVPVLDFSLIRVGAELVSGRLDPFAGFLNIDIKHADKTEYTLREKVALCDLEPRKVPRSRNGKHSSFGWAPPGEYAASSAPENVAMYYDGSWVRCSEVAEEIAIELFGCSAQPVDWKEELPICWPEDVSKAHLKGGWKALEVEPAAGGYSESDYYDGQALTLAMRDHHKLDWSETAMTHGKSALRHKVNRIIASATGPSGYRMMASAHGYPAKGTVFQKSWDSQNSETFRVNPSHAVPTKSPKAPA